jgi:hypothetical protein
MYEEIPDIHPQYSLEKPISSDTHPSQGLQAQPGGDTGDYSYAVVPGQSTRSLQDKSPIPLNQGDATSTDDVASQMDKCQDASKVQPANQMVTNGETEYYNLPGVQAHEDISHNIGECEEVGEEDLVIVENDLYVTQ